MNIDRALRPGAGDLAARRGPLSGVVVLDITRVVAGPYCAMLLADLGATVIKVENPSDPDYARTFPPFAGDNRKSAFFTQYNRNKKGITLDLKSEEGRSLLRALVAKADVLIENFRPGTMEKLGVGYEELCKANPALVYTAISGFGRTGPNSSRPAYDNTGQAAGGLWSMNGYADQPPVRVGTIIGDLAASLYAALGTVAALREAERTGKGQVVDVSQQDSVLSLTENAVVRYTLEQDVATPLGNDHPFVRPYGQFACKDGHVFFGGYTDKFWRISCEIFGTPELASDPEIDTMEKRFDQQVYERRILPILDGWFMGHTKAELEESMGTVVMRAFRDPSYAMIFMGFFSCGYQLAFVTAHFPAMVAEMCGPLLPGGILHSIGITSTSALGAVSLSMIGVANIGGTLLAGWLGKRYSKKYLLAAIYTGRTIAAAVFILMPITPGSVLIFSAVMGSLWLATVPLTSGLVAHLYGLRYMGTLYGFVFLSHQIGSFIGVWLGGRMYDIYGDYTLVWWIGVGVGAFSAIVHLPVREKPNTPAPLAA